MTLSLNIQILVSELIKKASDEDLEEFKDFLKLSASQKTSPEYSNANRDTWVTVPNYTAFVGHRLGASGMSGSGSSTSAVSDDVIDLSEEPDDLATHVTHPSTSKKRAAGPEILPGPPGPRSWMISHHARAEKKPQRESPEIIVILDSDEEAELQRAQPKAEEDHVHGISCMKGAGCSKDVHSQHLATSFRHAKAPPVKTEGAGAALTHGNITIEKNAAQRIKLTAKTQVAEVKVLDEVPKRWPAVQDVAYVVNFTNDPKVGGETASGKPKNLDAFLKTEDQDSWGSGTNGSTSQDTKLILLNNTPTRRSSHQCNGGLVCEAFDDELLPNTFQRLDENDISSMKKIFESEQEQNVAEGSSVLGLTAAFYCLVENLKCKKKECTGVAVLKPLRDSPSKFGKTNFVGCSKWKKGEEFEHLYAPIPASVDEHILFQLMNGQQVTAASSEDLLLYEKKCATLRHPRHGKQKFCSHIHFENGRIVRKKLVHRACGVKKVTYTSKDPNVLKVVVIFEGVHNHPVWPDEKPTHEAKDDLKRCLEACGVYGATPAQVDCAPSTIALLGVPLSEKHNAFRNRKVLSEKVKEHKLVAAPGVINLYNEDQTRPKEKRYFWHLRMDEDLKLVVTCNSVLANLIHTAVYLVCDYTFKRTQGELNEWEVAIFYLPTRERVTVARIYCNASTSEAFTFVWEGFFEAIENSTGRKVLFRVFNPTDGTILAVLMDMEAAQVQGFGKALIRLRFNDCLVSGIFENNPMSLVQYVLKLCSIHWDRSTDKLVGELGKDVVDYLNRFPALETPSDFDDWHAFCKNHANENLRNWYAHKTTYPWLLPGYNKHLSLMPRQHWEVTPNHTNLVESAHVASNRFTGIKLSPVEAIMGARKFDEVSAAAILKASTSFILRNPHNGESARMKRAVSRQVHQQKRQHEHQTLQNKINDVREQLAMSSSAQKDLREQLKTLTEQKKDAGRAPRHLSNSSQPRPSTSQQTVQHQHDAEELAIPPFIVPSNAPPIPERMDQANGHLPVFNYDAVDQAPMAWNAGLLCEGGALAMQVPTPSLPVHHPGPTRMPPPFDENMFGWEFEDAMFRNMTL